MSEVKLCINCAHVVRGFNIRNITGVLLCNKNKREQCIDVDPVTGKETVIHFPMASCVMERWWPESFEKHCTEIGRFYEQRTEKIPWKWVRKDGID